MYVNKTDAQGNFVWARQFAGAGNGNTASGLSMVVDVQGSVYITGYFMGTIDFDPGPGVLALTSMQYWDVFAMKLDSMGDLVWVRGFGGTQFDEPAGIAVGDGGEVYVTGHFASTVDFDPGPNVFPMTADFVDVFVLKLDDQGDFLWARQFGGVAAHAYGGDIDVAEHGAIVVSGGFRQTVDFDPGPNQAMFSANGTDIFVVKMDDAGDMIWARQLGGVGIEAVQEMTLDPVDGGIYLTGEFNGTCDFDPGPNVYNLPSGGGNHPYLAKLTKAGDFEWAHSYGYGTPQSGYAFTVVVDHQQNVYFGGSFYGTIDFDPGVGVDTLTSTSTITAFECKLDRNGQHLWVVMEGGPMATQVKGMDIGFTGAIYATGIFNGATDFDPSLGIASLSSLGSYDIFLLKLDGCPSASDSISVTACDQYFAADGQIYTQSGTYALNFPRLGGCGDSLVTLHLSLGYSNKDTIAISTCDPWTAPDGQVYTQSGNYLAVIPNAVGCDSLITILFTLPSVNVGVTNIDPTLIAQASGAQYQWLDCDSGDAAIPGATCQSFTPLTNGHFAVVVAQGGCMDTSACEAITNIVALANPIDDIGIAVYPNPGSERILISCEQSAALTISDVHGKCVLQRQLEAGTTELDVRLFPAGIYQLQCISPDGRQTLRLVIVH
jgi:hypothetical protein